MVGNAKRAGTVFIVDDDAAVRNSLMILLDAHGLNVEGYQSVAEFAGSYRHTDRACLVLDQHMPGATGLQFLASADGRQLGMPVIMITGGDDKIRALAEAMGVFAFLSKPIPGDQLLAMIDGAIARG